MSPSANGPASRSIPRAVLALALLGLGGLGGLGGGAAAHPRDSKRPDATDGLWHDHARGLRALPAVFAERHGFLGIWRKSAGRVKQDLVLDADWPAFRRRFDSDLARGLRLVDLETYDAPGGRRWAGLFRAGAEPQRLASNLAWRDFERRARSLAEAGLLPIDVETWTEGGVRRWTGVFAAGKGAYRLTAGDTAKDFSDRIAELVKSGLRPVEFEVYVEQGTPRYAGVFRASDALWQFWVSDDETFHRRYHDLADQGLRLVDLETFHEPGHGGAERYAALWRRGSGEDWLWINSCPGPCGGAKELTHQAGDLRAKWSELQNLELVDFETALESSPAAPGGFTAAAPAPPRTARAKTPAKAPAQGAPAGPAGPGGLTGRTGPPDISHAPPLHNVGSTGPP